MLPIIPGQSLIPQPGKPMAIVSENGMPSISKHAVMRTHDTDPQADVLCVGSGQLGLGLRQRIADSRRAPDGGPDSATP